MSFLSSSEWIFPGKLIGFSYLFLSFSRSYHFGKKMSPVLFQGPCIASGRVAQCLCAEAAACDTNCTSICCFLMTWGRSFGELRSHVARCLKRETSVDEPKAAQAEEKPGRIPSLARVSGPTDIIVSSPWDGKFMALPWLQSYQTL